MRRHSQRWSHGGGVGSDFQRSQEDHWEEVQPLQDLSSNVGNPFRNVCGKSMTILSWKSLIYCQLLPSGDQTWLAGWKICCFNDDKSGVFVAGKSLNNCWIFHGNMWWEDRRVIIKNGEVITWHHYWIFLVIVIYVYIYIYELNIQFDAMGIYNVNIVKSRTD